MVMALRGSSAGHSSRSESSATVRSPSSTVSPTRAAVKVFAIDHELKTLSGPNAGL